MKKRTLGFLVFVALLFTPMTVFISSRSLREVLVVAGWVVGTMAWGVLSLFVGWYTGERFGK